MILDDLIHVVFHRALASSVDVKDGTLTSRAVPLFWGQQLITYFAHTKKHGKTSLHDRSVTSRTASVLYLSVFPSVSPSVCLFVCLCFLYSFFLSVYLFFSFPHPLSLILSPSSSPPPPPPQILPTFRPVVRVKLFSHLFLVVICDG